jgi:hypothetical protein
LWLDDKGVELIPTNAHGYKAVKFSPCQKKPRKMSKKGNTCPVTPKGSMLGNMPPILGREEPGNWPASPSINF